MIIKIFSDDEELLVTQEWYEDCTEDSNEERFWGAMRSAQAQIEKEESVIPTDE